MKNKEQLKDKVLEIVDRYYQDYDLPEMRISDGEWEALVYNICKHLKGDSHRISALNIIIRRALNIAMNSEYTALTMFHVISALNDLSVFDMSIEKINQIKYDIMLESLLNNSKIEHSKHK